VPQIIVELSEIDESFISLMEPLFGFINPNGEAWGMISNLIDVENNEYHLRSNPELPAIESYIHYAKEFSKPIFAMYESTVANSDISEAALEGIRVRTVYQFLDSMYDGYTDLTTPRDVLELRKRVRTLKVLLSREILALEETEN
jgi:hypothetical protein